MRVYLWRSPRTFLMYVLLGERTACEDVRMMAHTLESGLFHRAVVLHAEVREVLITTTLRLRSTFSLAVTSRRTMPSPT